MAQTSPNPSYRPSTSSPSPSIPRSLLAKLQSPFSSKSRAVSDFYIQPEQPYRTYSPGDQVKGAIILKVSKPIRITHLAVCLHGSAQVFKNGLLERWTTSTPKAARRTAEQRGDGFKLLCHDEVVLCGEGRLEASTYEFHFNLEFPRKDLPSSIDFGRGIISYTITSNLTRPTTVNPVTSCDYNLQFNETIDVGLIETPKSRLITLEPIEQRSRSKVTIKRESSPQLYPNESNKNATPPSTAQVTRLRAGREHELSQSPGPSETSSASSVSGSTTASIRPGSASSPWQSKGQSGQTKKTITAIVELLRGGCLPGDLLPLKITISHNKHIKSLQGIIVTIYRQGRLELNNECNCNDGSCNNCSSRDKENADQKSKAKLIGSAPYSAGSTTTYRKDLCQTCSPLIVDPQVLKSVIRVSIRMPEDVFPTISSVPGSLISFRYFVEVVLDLKGKLAGQDRFLSHLKIQMDPPSDGRGSNTLLSRLSRNDNLLSTWDGSIIDTVRLRHEKPVVACLFEVVVGTINSGRSYNRRMETKEDHRQPESITDQDTTGVRFWQPSVADPSGTREDDMSHRHDNPAQNVAQEELQLPILMPPPEVIEDVDEKTRLRQAEERLLPSSPPQQEVGSQLLSDFAGPSAPVLFGADQSGCSSTNLGFAQHFEPSAPPIDAVMPATASDTRPSDDRGNTLDSVSIRSPNVQAATDDKQELERRRLLAEASAPDDHPEDAYIEGEDNEAGPSAAPSVSVLPSAPVLTNEEYGGFGQGPNNEFSFQHEFHNPGFLPRYEQ